jgi:hypothetical protein
MRTAVSESVIGISLVIRIWEFVIFYFTLSQTIKASSNGR